MIVGLLFAIVANGRNNKYKHTSLEYSVGNAVFPVPSEVVSDNSISVESPVYILQ